MFKIISLFSRWLLALAFLTGSAAAVAGPTYHVDVDGSSLTGAGYLILDFLGVDPSASATATVTNWSGSFLGTGNAYNDATIDFTAQTLSLTSGTNGYLFDVALGGSFGFDVSFDLDSIGAASIFGVALADGNGDYLTGDDLVDITVAPQMETTFAANADYANVTPTSAAVPEPSTLLSLFTGIGLMGFSLRRRMR